MPPQIAYRQFGKCPRDSVPPLVDHQELPETLLGVPIVGGQTFRARWFLGAAGKTGKIWEVSTKGGSQIAGWCLEGKISHRVVDDLGVSLF